MKKYDIKAATDITGFGLGGHALKMARASNVTISIKMKKVPLIGNAYKIIDDGCIPGASFRNLDYADEHLFTAPDLDYNLKMIAFDAQTSGGLLMSVPKEKVDAVLTDLIKAGLTSSVLIGEVSELKNSFLVLEN